MGVEVYAKAIVIAATIVVILAKPTKLDTKKYYDLNQTKQLFDEFVATYNKDYVGDTYTARYNVFVENLKRINKLNEENDNATHGITQFSDMTQKEFQDTILCFKMNIDDDGWCTKVESEDYEAPESWDWRDHGAVTDVKDQQQCGSCWAFGVSGNIESQYFIKHKQTVKVSEQQMVDCDKSSLGCNGGHPAKAMEYINKTGGIEGEDDYPYVARDCKCTFDESKVKVKVTACKLFHIKSEDHMRGILHKYGPQTIGVDATRWSTYDKGVYQDWCEEVNHAVLLVGYGQENNTPYWLVKNSWGDQFGDSGYIKLRRDEQTSCIGSSVITSIVE